MANLFCIKNFFYFTRIFIDNTKIIFCFGFLFIFAWMARNLVRGHIGRSWMAIRDMDIAAEIIGVNPLKAKLSAAKNGDPPPVAERRTFIP